MRRIEIRPRETYLIPAGTMHALGPGVVLYEVQQSSDITYRIYDWGRPATMSRPLHIEKAIAVTDAHKTAVLTPPPDLQGTSSALVASCRYFSLDLLRVADQAFAGDTEQHTFHVLTPTSGAVDVTCAGETLHVDRRETALIAGSAGAYHLRALEGPATVLRASVPHRAVGTDRPMPPLPSFSSTR
jgi:mannose-6-phosphate isomerase